MIQSSADVKSQVSQLQKSQKSYVSELTVKSFKRSQISEKCELELESQEIDKSNHESEKIETKSNQSSITLNKPLIELFSEKVCSFIELEQILSEKSE